MIRIRRPTTARVFALLALASAFLGGCGGDGSSESNNSAAGTSTSTASSAPAISLNGVPAASVTAGSAYMFRPSASSSSGAVTFSITGQPAWASFDDTTGELSGTPTSAEVGTTAGITITASDGGATASIGPFSIEVNASTSTPPATGSVTLSWVAPDDNTNGSPITNLAGYRIYYGTDSDALTQFIVVAGAATTTYSIENLGPGTWYFAVSAYNSEGVDSAPSETASKTI